MNIIRRSAAASAALVFVTAIAAPSAGAAPIDQKRAEAARLESAIAANGTRIAALGERYNGARLAMDQAAAGIVAAQRAVDAAAAQVATIRSNVSRRAASLYKSTGDRTPLDALAVERARDLGARSKYGSAAANRDGGAIELLRRRQEDLAVQQRNLEEQRRVAQAQRDAAAAARADLQAANARQASLLGSVKGDIARLVREEQARRDAAARAAAQARFAAAGNARRSTPGLSGARRPAPNDAAFPNVPVSGRVAAVIAYARAQIGKPYAFATSGPNTFDCSGLTMMAWRQAGVSMAHFSGAQFKAFPHVPLNALEPGDLVFKGPGGRDHVALYIGGGMQIAATQTGSFVKLQPVSTNLSGAVRPG